MKLKLALSAIAACSLVTGAALAEAQSSSAGSGAGGVAAAGPRGSVAGGVAVSKAEQRQQQRKARKHSGQQGQQAMSTTRCVPGTASTSTTGAVYTDRNAGSAAINTNGTASGSGTVRSSSEGDVYSSTDRSGSQADAYGNSTAVAREPTRRC